MAGQRRRCAHTCAAGVSALRPRGPRRKSPAARLSREQRRGRPGSASGTRGDRPAQGRACGSHRPARRSPGRARASSARGGPKRSRLCLGRHRGRSAACHSAARQGLRAGHPRAALARSYASTSTPMTIKHLRRRIDTSEAIVPSRDRSPGRVAARRPGARTRGCATGRRPQRRCGEREDQDRVGPVGGNRPHRHLAPAVVGEPRQ